MLWRREICVAPTVLGLESACSQPLRAGLACDAPTALTRRKDPRGAASSSEEAGEFEQGGVRARCAAVLRSPNVYEMTPTHVFVTLAIEANIWSGSVFGVWSLDLDGYTP
jgi:hypothetical protein